VPRIEPVSDDILGFTDPRLGDHCPYRFGQWTRRQQGSIGGNLPISWQSNPDQNAVVIGTLLAPGLITALRQSKTVPPAVYGAVNDWAFSSRAPRCGHAPGPATRPPADLR
jgi:hypothetical protein